MEYAGNGKPLLRSRPVLFSPVGSVDPRRVLGMFAQPAANEWTARDDTIAALARVLECGGRERLADAAAASARGYIRVLNVDQPSSGPGVCQLGFVTTDAHDEPMLCVAMIDLHGARDGMGH